MKHPLFPLLLMVFLCMPSAAFAAGSCQEHLASLNGTSREAVEISLKRKVEEFRTLAERALMLRAETIKVGKAIKDKIDRGRPLTGDDISLINTGINEHLALRDELLAVAESHECWLDGSERELARQGITPGSRLTGVMLSLSSAMLLYDNYLLAISLFEGDSKLRRILNERDPGYKVKSAALAKITMNYDSVGNRARVRKAIRFYEREISHAVAPTAHDRESEYLRLLIDQSPSYSMVKEWSPLYVIGRKLGFLAAVTTDTMSGMEREGVSLFSMVFGNAVGLVETRRGKLYKKEKVLADIGASLKAGDIREARAHTIMLALRQVGKPYDFNFDVESKERVYCSKLVYLSYSGIDWPTRKSLGRTTFTPDDVAAKVTRDGALQLVTFYHDGERVSDAPIVRMAELMGISGRGR